MHSGVRDWFGKLALIAAAAYLPAFGYDLWSVHHPRFGPWTPFRGLYVNDPVLHVVLRPGFEGRFDNGNESGRISINSLGARDTEPTGDGSNRVLLVGDSFAFGFLLDQDATIDSVMERERPGRDIYNLGVPGYNLPEQNEILRRCALPAKAVLYLYYANDSGIDRIRVERDGYILTQEGPGVPSYDEQMAAIRRRIADAESARRKAPIRSAILPATRSLIRDSISQFVHPTNLVAWESRDPEASLRRGVPYTKDMRALAESRGMKFLVVVVPTREEAAQGGYNPVVRLYVQGLRDAGIEPVELLHGLRESDYFSDDLHFNARGARVAARALNEALDKVL